MREERPRVESENPELSIVEKAKIIGERWIELDEEFKRPFIREAEEGKRKYQEEMANYVKEFGKIEKVKRIRKR